MTPLSVPTDPSLSSVDGLLRGIAKRYARPGLEADDLWQEARIALIKVLPTFDPSRSKFSGFAAAHGVAAIRRYVRNSAAMVRKPVWRWQLGDREELCPKQDVESDPPYDPRESMDSTIFVEHMLSRLRPIERKVMRMHIDGYSDVEIGRACCKSSNWVRWIRKTAAVRLREYLQGDAELFV